METAVKLKKLLQNKREEDAVRLLTENANALKWKDNEERNFSLLYWASYYNAASFLTRILSGNEKVSANLEYSTPIMFMVILHCYRS